MLLLAHESVCVYAYIHESRLNYSCKDEQDFGARSQERLVCFGHTYHRVMMTPRSQRSNIHHRQGLVQGTHVPKPLRSTYRSDSIRSGRKLLQSKEFFADGQATFDAPPALFCACRGGWHGEYLVEAAGLQEVSFSIFHFTPSLLKAVGICIGRGNSFALLCQNPADAPTLPFCFLPRGKLSGRTTITNEDARMCIYLRDTRPTDPKTQDFIDKTQQVYMVKL